MVQIQIKIANLTDRRLRNRIIESMIGVTKVKIFFRYLAFSSLLAMILSGANAQDFDKGMAAIDVGDYQTALIEFLPLAERGNALAQLMVGRMYDDGNGVVHDDVEAVKWYRLAADQGVALAQFSIGMMYRNGNGVVQDYVEAVKWLRLSADQGEEWAQVNIGIMYSQGRGVIQNNVIAHMWYNIASANGQENSAELRDLIAAKMTQEAIEKAQTMAQECVSSGYKNCGE